MSSSKKVILGITLLVLVLLGFIFFTPKATKNTSYYVPVKESDSSIPSYSGFNADKVFDQQQELYQTWENGRTARVILPLFPIAKPSIQNQGSVKYLTINSDDYQMRIYQLQDVKNSSVACANVIENAPLKELFPDAKNSEDSSIDEIPTKVWEFTKMRDQFTDQTFSAPEMSSVSCITHGEHSIWITEMYVSKEKYENGYNEKLQKIVKAFAIN